MLSMSLTAAKSSTPAENTPSSPTTHLRPQQHRNTCSIKFTSKNSRPSTPPHRGPTRSSSSPAPAKQAPTSSTLRTDVQAGPISSCPMATPCTLPTSRRAADRRGIPRLGPCTRLAPRTSRSCSLRARHMISGRGLEHTRNGPAPARPGIQSSIGSLRARCSIKPTGRSLRRRTRAHIRS